MTDRPSPTTPEDPDVELVSAYIDGEAEPDEMARVEGDRALRTRAEQLRSIAGRLAVDDPPPGLLDRHVAGALAAFDTEASPEDAGPAGRREPATAPVTPLTSRARYLRIPLGAAAAVAAFVALVGALTLIDADRDDDTVAAPAAVEDDLATTAERLDADEGGTDDTAENSVAADLAPAGGALPATGGDRLEFATTDDLADYLASRDGPGDAEPSGDAAPDDSAGQPSAGQPGAGGGSADAESPFDPCDAVATTGVDPAAVQELLAVVVDGRDVTTVIASAGDDGRRMIVVDDASCDVVDDRRV